MNRTQWAWGLAGLGGLLLFAAPTGRLQSNPYIIHIATIAFFYAILASSWSLLAGYAGQFSFAHMAFMAIGAYTAGIAGKFIRFATAPTGTCSEIPLGRTWLVFLNISGDNCLDLAKEALANASVFRVPPVIGIILGIIMGGIFGFLIGVLVLRLRRTYLALFTIGFSEILRVSINAEIDLTDGPNGLELVPLFPTGFHLFGLDFGPTDKVPPYYVMLLLFLASMGLMYWLASSRFGLFIRALREDEEAAAALGVHIVRYKVLVFVITSMIAAAAGGVFAHFIGVITPNIILILQMSLVIAMAVIGGLESLIGAAIGAIVIEGMLEYLRKDFPMTTVMAVILTVIFTIVLYPLGRYVTKRFIYLQNIFTVIASFILAFLLSVFIRAVLSNWINLKTDTSSFLGILGLVFILGVAFALYQPVKKQLMAVEERQTVSIGVVSLALALLIALIVRVPVTTGLSYVYYDIFGSLFHEMIDMTTWRLVSFGLLLMLTLRFWNNGLISPIIQWFTRSGMAEETVAKRQQAAAEG